ncbi:MAG: GlcNAc-transferase family protein [Caldimonas sp.]
MDQASVGPLRRIFIGIPSYRDRETQWTVDDLFRRAEHPERLTVGICWQLEPQDEESCFERPYSRPEQVVESRVPAQASLGSSWARAQALALAGDEEYVLMIDAHMRFVDAWDSRLIAALESASGERTALSGWLPAYSPPNVLQPAPPGQTWLIGARELTPAEHPSVLRLGPVAALREQVPPLALTPFVVGNFLFARRAMFDAVPIDPHIYMYGQEIALSARLWTHGYDVWQPRDPLLFHYWKPAEIHRADAYKAHAGERVARSAARVRHLLGLEQSEDPAALLDLDRYGHGKVRRLDDLWRAAGVDPRTRTIDEVAAEGRWNQSPHGAPPTRPRIFVNIPAYRDRETAPTVRDLFLQATHPGRVFVGVCWQYDAREDPPHFESTERPAQVRSVDVRAELSEGACWARQQAFSLWRGEEYVLSIDAHSRFEPGWDELLLGMLSQCPSDRPLLTTYPAPYLLPDQRDRDGILKMAFREFLVDAPGTPPKLMYQTLRIAADALPDRPFPTATVGQGFMFAPAEAFHDVPFDPHVYFFGDDLSFAARAWTAGWDFFSPNRPVMFHLWDRSKRPGHWNDQPARAQRLREMTQRRVAHLVGIERTDDVEALAELDRYGLGNVRTLAAYEAFSGVDFARKTVSARARSGDVNVDTALAPPARRFAPALRTAGAIVIDDFLPEAEYRELFDFVSRMDYQYINTQGTVRRVWDLSNGFPLRSDKNLFVHAPHATTREGNFHYPSGTPLDHFVDAVQAANPDVGQLVGEPRPEGWHHFSVTAWIYPPNTGLSMHDDGAGVYSGAYVYYLNPEWKPHWGGLLILLDDDANSAIARRRSEGDGQAFYAKKWLHLSGHDELATENGLGRCIFPKKNRIVFIAPDAYHLVTRVLPEAGDNVRMSLAGFFHRRASTPVKP